MGRHKLEQSGVSGLGDLQKSREMPWFRSISSLPTDCLIPISLSSPYEMNGGEEEMHLGKKTGSRGGIRFKEVVVGRGGHCRREQPSCLQSVVGLRLLLLRVEL